jgi:low temperature requirement protein LtrA
MKSGESTYGRYLTCSPREGDDGAPGERATTFELFFELVYVFAVTEVTDLLTRPPTGNRPGRGLKRQ